MSPFLSGANGVVLVNNSDALRASLISTTPAAPNT
jgi:hypothetical protein